MTTLGRALIAVAFLAGAWVAVQDTDAVGWAAFAAACSVGVIGLVISRLGSRAGMAERAERDWATLVESLRRVTENAHDLARRDEDLLVYDVHEEIDRLFPEDLARFAEAREGIVHFSGLEAYASVMSEYAAGERYLNRAWSASVDGYVDEVQSCLERAASQFGAAFRRIEELDATASS